MYPVNEPYAYVRIIYDHSTHEYTYQVLEPVLTDPEKELLKDSRSASSRRWISTPRTSPGMMHG